MAIYPDCFVTTLSKCKPGQLVRILQNGHAKNNLIVCDLPIDENTRGIVSLEKNSIHLHEYCDADTVFVLAFCGQLAWELDLNGPYEPPEETIFNKPGSILVSDEGSFLNIHQVNNGQRKTLRQLNIKDGCIKQYKDRFSRAAVFGAWKLFLEDCGRPIENRVEIATFCVKAGD